MKKAILVAAVLIGGAVAAWLILPRQQPEAKAPDAQAPSAGGSLYIYNWSDYIADDTISAFEEEFGIDVTYDVFDSNEVLEAKLLAGSSGFDIVVPTHDFLGRQIQAGVFAEIDKSQLGNYANLNPTLMAQLATYDPGNRHGVPYLWGTTGVGYNPDKVRAALGEDAPTNSWDLVMKPDNLAKLKPCGVAFLDSPTDIIPATLHYLGENPNSIDREMISGLALGHLLELRPHITYINSGKYNDDLANGDLCVAIGWSGDIMQAADSAAEGVTVEYVIPKEGANLWFDVIAIPKDAPNMANAHLFIDYLLRPEVIADISNAMAYANPNAASMPFLDEETRDNPNIYPFAIMDKLYITAIQPPEIDRVYTETWRSFTSGQDR